MANGSVLGSVLNQFSMHEYLGTFFVTTTEGAWWWTRRNLSKSKATSFRVSGRKLTKVGEVGNLGIGERIFSVRYVGDQGYVVTFRQIDPLYVIDLSNPIKLRVTRELNRAVFLELVVMLHLKVELQVLKYHYSTYLM